MDVYVFDWNPNREWEAICERHGIFVRERWFRESFGVLDHVESGDVVICHGLGRHDETDLVMKASSGEFWAILVSGQVEEPRAIGERCYHRGAAVGGSEDMHFGRYLKMFCEDVVETGMPRFGLLEPPARPEHLLAVLLLLLARKHGFGGASTNLGEAFWRNALDEWVEREGHEREWKNVVLPAAEVTSGEERRAAEGGKIAGELERAVELLVQKVRRAVSER